jgi:hypothetical protein
MTLLPGTRVTLIDGTAAVVHRDLPAGFPLGDIIVNVAGSPPIFRKVFLHEILGHDGVSRCATAGSPDKPYTRLIPFGLARMGVTALHRHHRAPHGHKFSIGLFDRLTILGVATVGRPVSRHLDDGSTMEVTRVATTGSPNACSQIYGALAREARKRGAKRLVTYTLPSESGASLRAAGWACDGPAGGGSWSRSSRPRQDRAPTATKVRWSKRL